MTLTIHGVDDPARWLNKPSDDELRAKIWREIQDAWPQLCDAMLSRLTEILWPIKCGEFNYGSPPYDRPTRFYPAPQIEVRDAGAKGRGVFALTRISAGLLIEEAPVTPFPNSLDLIPALADFPMAWTDDEDVITAGKVQLMNHSNDPNCFLERDIEARTIRTIALRDISVGEELTYKYETVWFDLSPDGGKE